MITDMYLVIKEDYKGFIEVLGLFDTKDLAGKAIQVYEEWYTTAEASFYKKKITPNKVDEAALDVYIKRNK